MFIGLYIMLSVLLDSGDVRPRGLLFLMGAGGGGGGRAERQWLKENVNQKMLK